MYWSICVNEMYSYILSLVFFRIATLTTHTTTEDILHLKKKKK